MKDLLYIASLLNEIENYHMPNNLFKFAQRTEGDFGQLSQSSRIRKLEEINYTMVQIIQKYKNLMARFRSGEINLEQFKTESESLNEERLAVKDEYEKIEKYYIESKNLPIREQQFDQKYLVSNSPDEFVKKLIDFKENNNLSNLVQAFNMYADAGAMYGRNYIPNDPRIQKLYQRVLRTPRFIYEQELVKELKNIIAGDE